LYVAVIILALNEEESIGRVSAAIPIGVTDKIIVVDGGSSDSAVAIAQAGGIPPCILPALEDERFLEAFRRKGRMSDLLARMPVHVILNPKIALLGAACHGLEPAHA